MGDTLSGYMGYTLVACLARKGANGGGRRPERPRGIAAFRQAAGAIASWPHASIGVFHVSD